MPARPRGPGADVSATWRQPGARGLARCPFHVRETTDILSSRPRSDPGPRSRELSAYLQRWTDFHSTIPVERDRVPRSIRGAHPVVADDFRATILLEPARLGRPNTVWHGLEPLPLLLPRHHNGQRMANEGCA